MSDKVRKFIELDRDDLAWLETNYPRVNFSSLFTMLLRAFRKVHTVVPYDYAELGAQELKRQLDGEGDD